MLDPRNFYFINIDLLNISINLHVIYLTAIIVSRQINVLKIALSNDLEWSFVMGFNISIVYM